MRNLSHADVAISGGARKKLPSNKKKLEICNLNMDTICIHCGYNFGR